uniref:BZIP domain-containing protein n=1 Tax=Syphacia muris TaxID=451379 RepID=A0A0N5ABC2_9BILA
MVFDMMLFLGVLANVSNERLSCVILLYESSSKQVVRVRVGTISANAYWFLIFFITESFVIDVDLNCFSHVFSEKNYGESRLNEKITTLHFYFCYVIIIVLNTNDTTSTSVVYQSTGTPTFYTTTGSPFQSNSAYIPSQTTDERKDYITVIPAGVHLSTASGIIPVNVSSCFTNPSECNEKSCITQMVQLTPIQTLPSVLPSENHQMIYDSVYVDQQEASTSGMLNDLSHMQMDNTANTTASVESDQKFDPSVKTSSIDTASLVGSDISDNSLQLKRMKQAEAARQRYQRLTPEERKEINAKRTLAQKRKRQRDKEIEELEGILRKSKDIVDDPAINEQLREKRIRARRAEAARLRYQRMSSEERRIYNQKRRMRQLGLQGIFFFIFWLYTTKRIAGQKKAAMDDEKVRQRILEQNAKKAEAARLRYHRMTEEEKRIYNQRRTEAFRRRRIQEEILLSTPAGRISAEALNKAQQIMMRNAKRAEAARLRYQRMTPEQRKAYNQKRSSAKKARERMSQANSAQSSANTSSTTNEQQQQLQINGDSLQNVLDNAVNEEALNALEKDVVRRTRQANMVLMKQRRNSVVDHVVMVRTAPDGTQTIIPATTLDDGKQVFHIPRNTTQHGLETINGGTVAIMDSTANKQEPLQLTTVPILSMPDQSSEPNDRPPEAHQLVPAAISQLPIMPQLAELHPLRPPTPTSETAQTDSQLNRNQAHSQQQPIIFAVQEAQQSVAHQIIVADLNQPTGVVLSSMSNQIRSRGRPPIYAAAAVAIQQQQQPAEQEQQGSVVLVPTTQLPLPVDSAVQSASLRSNNSRTLKNPNQVSVPSTGTQDILAVATAAVGNTVELTPQQKLEIQRAKRAERARMRYHNMSEEERRNFNARRANALRKARLRDEHLCMLAENAELNGGTLDEETLVQIEEAQRRRARRAEAARLKYHRMSSEERRQYNAVRDAQRRQSRAFVELLNSIFLLVMGLIFSRKREQEAAALSRQQQQHQQEQKQPKPQNDQSQQQQARQNEVRLIHLNFKVHVHDHQDNDTTNQTLIFDTYIQYEQPLEGNWDR